MLIAIQQRLAMGRGRDLFRARKLNTSRPPSMHVDDFMNMVWCESGWVPARIGSRDRNVPHDQRLFFILIFSSCSLLLVLGEDVVLVILATWLVLHSWPLLPWVVTDGWEELHLACSVDEMYLVSGAVPSLSHFTLTSLQAFLLISRHGSRTRHFLASVNKPQVTEVHWLQLTECTSPLFNSSRSVAHGSIPCWRNTGSCCM